MFISNNTFRKNCSKLLVVMHVFSLSPTFAMENIEDSLDNQNIIESPVLSNSEVSSKNEVIEESIGMLDEEDAEEVLKEEKILNEDIVENKDVSIEQNEFKEEIIFDKDTIASVVDSNANVLSENENNINGEITLSSDATLKSLGFYNKNSGELTEAFSPSKKDYIALVKGNSTVFRLGNSSIATNSSSASMNIYFNDDLVFENVTGTSYKTFTLVNGITNIMKIIVTAENGEQSIYTISFEREGASDSSLSALNFSNKNIYLTELFSPNKRDYIAVVKGNVNMVSFSSGAQTIRTSDDYATMDIYFNDMLICENQSIMPAKSFYMVRGITNRLLIEVTSENGTKSIYTVVFEREGSSDAALDKLGFYGSNIKLTETFNPEKKDYIAVVSGNANSFQLYNTIKVRDPFATMDIYLNDELICENITISPSKTYYLVKDKINVLKVVVDSESGVENIYTVVFEREGSSDAALDKLGFYGGNIKLTETFNPEKKDYIAVVSGNANSFQLYNTIKVRDPFATMDIYLNDELICENITISPSKTYYLVNGKANILKIVVTSENGNQAVYTVMFERDGYDDTSLSNLGFYGKGVSLTQTFNPEQKDYVAMVEKSINLFQLYNTIRVRDPFATMAIYFNDELVCEGVTVSPSKTYNLVKGITNVLKVVVTSENGNQDVYTVVFERELDSNVNIVDFSINKGSLEFKDDVYVATIDSWRDISVSKLVLEDFWADYKIILNGEKEISLNEKFDLGIGDNKLDIEVTSNNGTKKTYPVIFERTDGVNPSVNYNIDNQDWTKEDVLINISSSDDSGIRYIELPNGEKVYSNKAEFYVNQNGIYEFKVYDNFLNETVEIVEINNIDKELPKLELKPSTTDLTNESVDIIINVTDNVGLKYIETPDGQFIIKNTLTYTVHEDGTYLFKVVDLAGNEVEKSITLNNIDSIYPTLATELSNEDWSNEELTLSVFAMSDKGIKYIELPDGTKVEDNVAEYGINENGVYIVATESLGGNITTEKVVVSNIDTEQPILKISSSNEKLTNNSVLIGIEGVDNVGIDYIVLPNGEKIYESSYNFEVNGNGNYEFTVVDLAGNECTEVVEINNIDKELPKLELNLSTSEITNSSVDVTINATDNVGIKYVEAPNGEIITNGNFRYTVYEDGTYVFKVVDLVGNETVKSIDVNNIDNVNPTLDIEVSNVEWTNKELTLNIEALSNKGIKYIYLPDGTKIEGNYAEYTISQNGTYIVATESLGGNTTTETINVTNIDKELPTLILKPSTDDWTNKDITISILGDDNAGVDYIILPNGEKVYESAYNYVVKDNNDYEFEIVDLAGNSYKNSIKINNIDKEIPVVENHEELINVLSDVITLDISNISTLSGIYKIILPNGEEIINPIENIIKFRAAKNGTYRFIIIDGAGNSLDVDVPVSTIKEQMELNDNMNNNFNDSEYNIENLNNVEDLSIVNNVGVDEVIDNNLNENIEGQSSDLKYESLKENEKSIKSSNSIVLGSIVFSTVAAIGYYMFNKKK